MTRFNKHRDLPARLAMAAVAVVLATTAAALQAATAEEAATLSSTLTPLGAERAGNKEGTIPAWTGAVMPYPNYKSGSMRPDPFAGEKPLFSINAKNMDQYADKLSDGTKAMLKKFPDTYRLDVYATKRTGVAPQWVYDNTLKNATRAKVSGPSQLVSGAYGGVPFPIPKAGIEVMWNHLLRWRGENVRAFNTGYLVNAGGQRTLISIVSTDTQMPYYFKDGSLDEFEKSGDYWKVFLTTTAPALRAGELIVGRENVDGDKTQVWIYFTGQRRTRKVPNACCDTPQTSTGGLMSFDEIFVWTGRMDRFDWKIVGKKEVYVPYNANALLTGAKEEDSIGANHLNPDRVRWELHRTWVVEADLKPGQRHPSPKSRYYIDEDTWYAVLADRWDAKGQLARTLWAPMFAMPDMPAATTGLFGFNDMLSGAWYVSGIPQVGKPQYEVLPRIKDAQFTPDAMAGEGVR